MDVSKAVDQRISTRAFLPDALSEAEVREWLTQAQRAPSGGNVQPWRTIAVTGQAKDDVITMAAPMKTPRCGHSSNQSAPIATIQTNWIFISGKATGARRRRITSTMVQRARNRSAE